MEIRTKVDDEQYALLERDALERHEDPTLHAGRVLAQKLNRAKFFEGCAEALAVSGMREEIARRLGPDPGSSATTTCGRQRRRRR
jgi:hypothetical protein